MGTKCSRREFLRIGAGSAAVVLIAHDAVVRGQDNDITAHFETRTASRQDGRDPIHAYVHSIDDQFNRKTILGQAIAVLHSRFRDIRVARNAYSIAPNGYFIDRQAWNDSNIEPHPTIGPKDMLWQQLTILRLPNSALEPGDGGPPVLPPIHLHPIDEPNEVWGRAPLNRVQVTWEKGDTWRRTGAFKVFVNIRHLGLNADGGSDPFKWASVIAHEMLHSLGHRHGPDTGPQDYTNNLQINAFHRAVFCNGNYDGGKLKLSFG